MRLRLAFKDSYPLYKESLIPSMIAKMCNERLEITNEEYADLIIVGPSQNKKQFFQKFLKGYQNKRAKYLFHTGENVRFNEVKADFAISFDLSVEDKNHLRWPLWMDSIRWREYGLDYRPENIRFGRAIEIEQLMAPLGQDTLERQFKAAIFTRHLKEPRDSLIKALRSIMQVDGFGRAFDNSIKSHDASGFCKYDILKDYIFNLCPENSLYPGYYTEKIVEAYAAGCIPITWADPNVKVDFKEGSFINCHPFAAGGYDKGLGSAVTKAKLERLVETPLLSDRPSLLPLREFLDRVIVAASKF
jgi:Glycosyltransferase family 10 (fucosyltransferase) C-term/Alpha-(1,3)-fucosyltransferase FucT N-terminal domain